MSKLKYILKIPSILFFCFVITNISHSQSAAVFGQNKVQYKEFHWKILKTKHFDIYFYQGGKELAQFAAHVIEKSLKNMSENFDFNITNRIPMVVYNSHNDFQQNNVVDEYMPEGVGGVTELFKNRINVPFEGDYEKFRHVIHHELVHAFMNDIYYGGTIQNIISKNISLAFPLWFSEGMAEVQSNYGLNKATDMFMRDATIHNYVPPLEYINGYFAYRGGQSFFAFLAETYGEDKIGILMNSIKSLGDIDLAFKETYKLSLGQLDEKWQSYLKKTYWPDIKFREEVKDFSKQLTNHKRDGGSYNVAPTISPDGQKFAFISNQDDLFDVYIASTKNGRIIDKVISGNSSTDFEELHILTPGLSWSPNGKKLAISVKAGASDVIYLVDAKTGDKETLPLNFDGIFYVVWSPLGDNIAFIGNKGAYSDLYIFNLNTRKLTALTNDIFSDHNPTWALDGKTLFFTSDRGDYVEGSKIPKDFKMWDYDYSNTDYYRIDISTKEITRLSDTYGTKEGFGQISPDGKKILYVSDKNGISNIYLRETDSAGKIIDRPITNSLSPVDQISISRDGKKLLFVALYKGGYDIFSLDNPFEIDLGMDELEPTEFVLRMQSYAEKFGRENYNLGADSLDITEIDIGTRKDSVSAEEDNTASQIADSVNTEISDNPEESQSELTEDSTNGISGEISNGISGEHDPESLISEKQLNDSLRVETEKKIEAIKDSIKLYGEDVAIKFREKPTTNTATSYRDSTYSENSNFNVSGNMNSDGTYKFKDYKIKFTPDLVYGNANYASFYGVQGIAQIALSDMLGDHRIYIQTSLVIDLKNSDYAVAYYNLAKRVDFGVQLFHTARFVSYGTAFFDYLYRYRTFGASGMASYPISRFKRFDGALAIENISRENLDLALEPVTRKTLLVPSLSFIHDNTQFGYTSPVAGTRYNLTLMGSPKFGSDGIGFTSVLADIRNYLKLSDDYTFATRVSGGASFGPNPMQFFIGGTDNWINYQYANYNLPVSSIEDYAFLSPGLPLRGYDYDQQAGSKYYIVNMEMRFPLFKYLIFGALPLGFANIEGVTFLDMGTAWTDNSSVKLFGYDINGNFQTNDLLIGTGVGARANLFGFPFKFDVAWRYNMNKFSNPKYYISLGYNF